MSELLLELFSEEIPARMQKRAGEDLRMSVISYLHRAGIGGFTDDEARVFATPRRLVLTIQNVKQIVLAQREERKGPKVGAPEQAIQGFLRSAGLTSIDQAKIQEDKKGAFYVAVTETPTRSPEEVLGEAIPEIIRSFPWPKSMRWGSGSLRWVRPLHSILCILGGRIVPIEIEGISADNMTYGHRFMSPDGFAVSSFADYEEKLEKAKVILDPEKRAKAIHEGALHLAQEAGLHLVEDEALLNEVAGLVEWPVPLMGKIDEEFMSVPQEVLTSTMRANQKYFALKDADGHLAPRFIVVANLIAEDGGEAIVNGNERVLRARFSDARFLWDQDRKVTLESRLPKLEEVVFHAKLGTVREKAERIAKLARELAPVVGGDPDKAELAGRLCKADLTSGMVGEFPELQGLMGSYYARADGLGNDVADAIAEHYAPLGPADAVPASPLGKVVALADKIDTLTGFWAIDEKPTGSKDPYALRRAALGVIRIVLEGGLRTHLLKWGNGDLLSFFADRLKVYLRDRGARHDLVDAVFALEGQDDLVLVVKRVEALSEFLGTDDGKNLLAGYKRAVNILTIEEKKDKAAYGGAPDQALFGEPEERALFDRIEEARAEATNAVAREDFAAAMRALAKLRAPVDAFFGKVTVNADNADVRANRLKLLALIRSALHEVADFSKVEG